MLTESENEGTPEKVHGICQKKGGEPLSSPPFGVAVNYFVFGEVAGAGLPSLSAFTPFDVRGVGEEVGLPVGDPAFTGEPDGEALGLGATLAVAEGDGLATGGLTGSGLFSHAPKTATLAAKTVDKMNDLLIVFLLNN